MSDEPMRLRDPAAGETEIVRDVLGAGDDFGPTPEGLDRVAARLAVVLPPGAFPKPVVTPHAIAPIVKMIAGLSVVAAVGGGVWLGTTSDTPTTTQAPHVTAPLVPSPSLSASAAEVPSPVSPPPPPSAIASSSAWTPSPRPAQLRALPSSSSPPVVAAPPTVVEATPSESEGSMMARGQVALAQHAPAEALAITAAHAREYPHGNLVEDRERIAIEALVRLGRWEEARARRDQFLRTYPRTAYRERMDALFSSDASR